MKYRIVALVLALSLLLAGTVPALADIKVDGDKDFKAAVQKCLDQFVEAGGDTAAFVKALKDSKNTHTIQKSDKDNHTDVTNNGTAPAAGGTGKGEGTTIHWDPNYTDKYQDGTARDPCASLLHELRHAYKADTGSVDTRVDAATGIMQVEIDACREENRYRKSKGLPQRKQYGPNKLPPDAIFTFMPNRPAAAGVSLVVFTQTQAAQPQAPALFLPASFTSLVEDGGSTMNRLLLNQAQVRLTALPSKASYAPGEPVVIDLTLTNTGTEATCVCDRVDGTLMVTALQHNGADGAKRSAIALYDEDPAYLLVQCLHTLNPGESLALTWTSANDLVLGGQTVETVQYQPDGKHQATLHMVGQPGSYQLSFVYQYPPLPGTPSQVYQAQTNQATVVFSVGLPVYLPLVLRNVSAGW